MLSKEVFQNSTHFEQYKKGAAQNGVTSENKRTFRII